jgi:pimeloyl-ACP methyl ester carboxylesterase
MISISGRIIRLVTELYVHESGLGDSPAVVFLHGAGVSGRMWAPHMSRLTAYHCLAPDLPGHGRSNSIPWRSEVHTADQIVELVETRIQARKAHLVGLSLGGSLVHTLLARRPDILDRVVIDGSGGLPWWGNRPFLLGITLISPFLHTRPVIAMLSRSVGNIPEADQADIRLASRRAFRRSFSDAFAVRITRAETVAPCPTLLVAGERETVARQSNAALAALMPNAEARYFPGAGHGWLGVDLDTHVAMVEAWLAARELPDSLVPETTAWPRAVVDRLLAAEIDARV